MRKSSAPALYALTVVPEILLFLPGRKTLRSLEPLGVYWQELQRTLPLPPALHLLTLGLAGWLWLC